MSSPKIKIGLVNVFFPPQSIGGATRVVADNLEALQRLYGDRFEFFAITADAGSQPRHTLRAYTWNGVRVYRIGIQMRVNMDWHPDDPAVAELVDQIYALEQPDLMHFHCIQRLGVGVLEAAQARGIPNVVTVHDAWWISDFQFLVDPAGTVYPDGHLNDYFAYEPPEGVTRAESIKRRMRLKAALTAANRSFAVSQRFTELYQRNGVGNVVPNPNGISAMAWEPRPARPTGRIVLGHVGGMSDHKGYHLFKQALEEGDYDHLQALVVDHSKPWGHLAHETWGTVPVTFIGRMPQDQVPALYGAIDVLFAPSIWPESFGLVTREAHAAGVWVVASTLGGIGEDVTPGENGFLVDPAQGVDALATVLQALEQNPDRYRQPCPCGDIRLADDQVRELVTHYDEVLAQAASPISR